MKISRKFKKRTLIYGIIIIILIYLIGIASGFYNTEYEKKPIIKEKVSSRDVDYLYNFYLSTTPNIDNRPYYGSEKASITVIIYTNPFSIAFRSFMEELYPQIKSEYINTGKIRLIHKNYLTGTDFTRENDNYMIAKALLCFKDRSDNYFDYFFDLLDIDDVNEAYDLANKYDVNDLEECVKKEEFKELAEDISEIENFGMVGINPRFYIGLNGKDNTVLDGVVSYTRFRNTIRTYQVLIGD